MASPLCGQGELTSVVRGGCVSSDGMIVDGVSGP